MVCAFGVAMIAGSLPAASHAQQPAGGDARTPQAAARFEATPRPPEDMSRLLTDAELAASRDSLWALEDPAYSTWVRTNAHPIRSLGASDFSDLRFLAPLLKDKRIVQLGESSHGVAEFNLAKVRLVRFLHEDLGYDVIAFESSFADCDRTQRRSAALSAEELMRGCLSGVWRTAEVLPLLEYVKATQRTDRPLAIAGFDIQFFRAESRFARDDDDPAVARQLVRSTAAWQLMWVDPRGPGATRDSAMAENLEFLLVDRYPGRKVIVWAHNAHIRHSRGANAASTPQQPRPMGSWVAKRRRAELYTVGLYMYRGSAAAIDRTPYPIRQSRPGSLESILHQAPWRYAFVDFSAAQRERRSEWIWSPLDALELGRYPDRVVPRNAYDAILFIETTHPPEYR